MEESEEEKYCELIYKKINFWNRVSIKSGFLAFIVSALSLILNFVGDKLNFAGLMACRIICIVLAVVGLFGLFFSWFRLSRLKKQLEQSVGADEELKN